MGAEVEQTDPGFQDPLEIFNIHWYAGAANALRAYSEKQREMMDPGLIEIANEGAEYSALGYLEAVGRRSELAIHMGRFNAGGGLRVALRCRDPPEVSAARRGRRVIRGRVTTFEHRRHVRAARSAMPCTAAALSKRSGGADGSHATPRSSKRAGSLT